MLIGSRPCPSATISVFNPNPAPDKFSAVWHRQNNMLFDWWKLVGVPIYRVWHRLASLN